MSSATPERLARRRLARERAIRRRRAAAALALAAGGGVLVWLLLLRGQSGHAGAAGQAWPAARARADARVHVTVSPVGELPAAVQDAASSLDRSGAVLLIGGLDSTEASMADVLRITGGTATTAGSLPSPLHDACAGEVGGAAYVFGGGQQASYSSILRLAAGRTAEPVGSLPSPASDVACATLGGTVYLIGGYTGQEPLRTILAWRPGAAPRLVGTLPKPLRYAAVGQVGGRILIAGGTSGVHASRDVYAFDPTSSSVRELSLLPHAVTHAAGASLGGALLVIGGRDEAQGSQRQSILAISSTGSVSVAGMLPVAMSDMSAVHSADTVILAGGVDRTGRLGRQILAVKLTR